MLQDSIRVLDLFGFIKQVCHKKLVNKKAVVQNCLFPRNNFHSLHSSYIGFLKKETHCR